MKKTSMHSADQLRFKPEPGFAGGAWGLNSYEVIEGDEIVTKLDHWTGKTKETMSVSKSFVLHRRPVTIDKITFALRHPHDPVGYNSQGWWFFNEVWADPYGPYPTEQIARAEMWEYGKIYLWMDNPWWP